MNNDIWGLKQDPQMAAVIAAHGHVACCLMHNRKQADYVNLPQTGTGIWRNPYGWQRKRESGRIDHPGSRGRVAKTYEQNLAAIRHLLELHPLGYPLLLGTSRKSVIGLTLEVPAKER